MHREGGEGRPRSHRAAPRERTRLRPLRQQAGKNPIQLFERSWGRRRNANTRRPAHDQNHTAQFTTGQSHAFGGDYLELVPHERIRYTDTFDDPNLPGVMEVTVRLKAVSVGAEVNIEQAGIPHVIPVAACYLGWQQSLAQLALLVEPDIPE